MSGIRRRRPADPDSVIAFSFGRRSEPRIPALSNADLAREIVRRYSALPILAQSEIASLLPPHLVRLCIAPTEPRAYLDTLGVASRALRRLRRDNLSRPVVVAHPVHLHRALATCRRLGLDAREPDGELRVRFDPDSEQWWTRGPIRWWLRELPTAIYFRRPLAAAARRDEPGPAARAGSPMASEITERPGRVSDQQE